jgi:hypothetical protein
MRMIRPLRLTALAVAMGALLLLASSCDDDYDSDSPSPQPPATTPTVVEPPDASRTGIEAVDRVLIAVENGDPVAFEALLRPQSLACSYDTDIGGPPNCAGAAGMPAEGTPVDVFPHDTCEREWQYDLTAFTERIMERIQELYAVVGIDPVTPPVELADGAYGIVYPDATGFATAHALIVTDDGVISVDSSCGGTAEVFLQDGPPFYGPELILEGSAFN